MNGTEGGKAEIPTALRLREVIFESAKDKMLTGDFSILTFAREILQKYPDNHEEVIVGLNEVARNDTRGYNTPLLTIISNAYGFTPETHPEVIIKKMMPFFVVGGRDLPKGYLPLMGFNRRDVERYADIAEKLYKISSDARRASQ